MIDRQELQEQADGNRLTRVGGDSYVIKLKSCFVNIQSWSYSWTNMAYAIANTL